MLTQNQINRAKLVSKCAQEYCLKENKRDVKPKELMPYLIEKGVYNKVKTISTAQIRDLLRDLDVTNSLDLIPQIRMERRGIYRYWYFNAA